MCLVDVLHDHEEAADGTRALIGDPFADGDRTGRAWWRQLNEAQVLVDGVVEVGMEADLVDVEMLGAIDVRHGEEDQLDLHVHTHTINGIQVSFRPEVRWSFCGRCPRRSRSSRVTSQRRVPSEACPERKCCSPSLASQSAITHTLCASRICCSFRVARPSMRSCSSLVATMLQRRRSRCCAISGVCCTLPGSGRAM